MNYTEEQILIKGKKVLNDIHSQYYDENLIEKALFDPNEELIRGEGTIPAWTVVINEPVSDSFIFLTISDSTGEPLYIQTKHLVREIRKDAEGKYIRIE
ncbi:MAG: hypothetical protein DI539_02780 [Flavobacterium psychrophilum]|nr:MAG: hypothetical protein DI539_02780 [Flavobacterium psychrophilum]